MRRGYRDTERHRRPWRRASAQLHQHVPRLLVSLSSTTDYKPRRRVSTLRHLFPIIMTLYAHPHTVWAMAASWETLSFWFLQTFSLCGVSFVVVFSDPNRQSPYINPHPDCKLSGQTQLLFSPLTPPSPSRTGHYKQTVNPVWSVGPVGWWGGLVDFKFGSGRDFSGLK